MKKDTIVAVLFILLSIPSGIFVSMFPNINPAYAMFQRIGHSLIIAGIFMIIREITFGIRKKLHPKTFSELFSLENDLIELNSFIIVKENNKITFKIDPLYHYFNILGNALLSCVFAYIYLPSMNLKQETEGLSEVLASLMIIFEMIFIIIGVICIFFILIQIYIFSRFNIIKNIDAERQTFTILKKKENLTIPFSNLKDLEVLKYENEEISENLENSENCKNRKKKKNKKNKKDKKSKEIYYSIVPISNYTGDIPLINTCRIDDSLIILRDYDSNEMLMELNDSLLNFLTKFTS